MEFIFVLAVILIKVLSVNLLQVVKIVRTFGIDALMDYEMLTLLLLYEGMGTVGTFEVEL